MLPQNGQLGYPSNATPIQHTPRKCAQITQPIKQIAATEVATVCLLEGGEVWVLHKDTNFKVTFPTTRFPTSMQVYRPPEISARPIITKVGGSGTTFIAVSSMGDVFSWQLENPSLETPSSATNLARDVKPTRVWDERKSFTAATDAWWVSFTPLGCRSWESLLSQWADIPLLAQKCRQRHHHCQHPFRARLRPTS